MTDQNVSPETADEQQFEDMITEADTGGRNPAGVSAKILFGIPLIWSLFQLWYASPLAFMLGFGVLNDTEARAIHLAFSIFLTFTAYPALKSSPRRHIPIQDWVFALVGAFAAAYIYLFYEALSERPGAPTTVDVVVAVIGMILLLEATRRALGPPLMVVATMFLMYTFFGPYMPDVIAHKGASLNKTMSHQWLSTEVCSVLPSVCPRASCSSSCCLARCSIRPAGWIFHSRCVLASWPYARRAGQGGGCFFGYDGTYFRFLDRKCGDHRHLHHPVDEASRILG